jgi:hypothetical protein
MPMNPRLLRPRSTIHPEAADWANRVRANGGSVSGSTLNAVSRFCASIAAAGIRDRFYRLNLFCGTGLEACLVPLYRGQSLGGTQYGGTTDTNNGPFVSGDYVETGASGGLIGNGTSKHLSTGLAPNALPSVATGHLSYWTGGGAVTATRIIIGTQDASHRYRWDMRTAAAGGNLALFGGNVAASNSTNPGPTTQADFGAGMFTATRTSATALTIYKNGSTLGENPTATTSTTPAAHGNNWFVFAYNNSGTATDFYQHRLRAYSIGDGLTGAQVAAFYSAINTFMGALSRL